MVFFKKNKRIAELEKINSELVSKNFDLEHELIEVQQFEKICDGKLAEWVKKHDELLVKYKELEKLNNK